MKKIFFLLVVVSYINSLQAQFPPAAGEIGTTAIPADSNIFVDWASTCIVERGWRDIAQTDSGYVDFGAANFATGVVNNSVVSLGDGGTATLSFSAPIINGPSWDFVVFENGFTGFLELAFVEVSSNGNDFYRFPATSLTDTLTPLGSFGAIDPSKINNLAGKYVGGFGTPFDLEELSTIVGLDVNNITHIRIVDVVGTLDDDYATRDADGRKINDPYPTIFTSGGFDLNAVGVIHSSVMTSAKNVESPAVVLYPNPIRTGQILTLQNLSEKILTIQLYDRVGKKIRSWEQPVQGQLLLDQIPAGLYVLRIQTESADLLKKLMLLP